MESINVIGNFYNNLNNNEKDLFMENVIKSSPFFKETTKDKLQKFFKPVELNVDSKKKSDIIKIIKDNFDGLKNDEKQLIIHQNYL